MKWEQVEEVVLDGKGIHLDGKVSLKSRHPRYKVFVELLHGYLPNKTEWKEKPS